MFLLTMAVLYSEYGRAASDIITVGSVLYLIYNVITEMANAMSYPCCGLDEGLHKMK